MSVAGLTDLTREQILLLLNRLKWEPVYENDRTVLCNKRGTGYSDNLEIARIEATLSIMLEVKHRLNAAKERNRRSQ